MPRTPRSGPTPAGLSDTEAAPPHYYGHRERLRQRLIEAGAETLPDY
jgi:DNA repair protein RadC